MFYGPLDKCMICGGTLELSDMNHMTYSCKGSYSEWSTCTYTTTDPPRKDEPVKLPESVQESDISDVIFQLWFICFNMKIPVIVL